MLDEGSFPSSYLFSIFASLGLRFDIYDFVLLLPLYRFA